MTARHKRGKEFFRRIPAGEKVSGATGTQSPQCPRSAGATWPAWAIGAAILLLTLAIYWQAAHFGFIRTDDELYVYRNAAVKEGLHWGSVLSSFAHAAVGNWHPLTMLSLTLDYQLAGPSPYWFHGVNIALHLIGTLCLIVALQRLTQCVWQSLFVGAVFALHPAHVESVAWISARKDVLSGVFLGLTLLAYSRYCKRPRLMSYLWLVICFVLGLMSKPMLVSVPILLLLLDYWPLARKKPRAIAVFYKAANLPLLEKAPLFVLAGISCVVTFIVQRAAGAMDTLESTPLTERLINALIAYVTYAARFFWPAGLAGLHPFTWETRPLWQPVLAAILLVVVTIIAARSAFSRPYLLMGWLWFVISLIPVIGLVQVGPQATADRYTYIPYIGLSIMLAWGAPELFERLAPKNHWPMTAALAVASAAAMAVLTYHYLPCWENDSAYWRRVVEIRPDFAKGHYNLALAARDRGDTVEALALYRRALQADARCPEANYGLANLLFSQGKLDEAVFYYEAELRINPRHAGVHNNLALVLLKRGQSAEAMKHFQAALDADPRSADALRNMGSEYLANKDWDSALEKFEAFLKIQPDDYDAHCLAARALAGKGQFMDATVHLQAAVRLHPENPSAYTILGALASQRGDLQDAVAYFRQALQLEPGFSDAQYHLALTLNALKQKNEAITAYRDLLKTHPDHYWGRNDLGVLLAEQGKLDEAIAQFDEAIRIDPVAEAAQNNRAKALLLRGRRQPPK